MLSEWPGARLERRRETRFSGEGRRHTDAHRERAKRVSGPTTDP
ncbi:hypothetical protein [Natronosalvus rutilus]|nr:hypothetical protein [Natronosalvus rutilus]